MRCYEYIDKRLEDPTCVALGTFDGVHRGHAAVIRTAVKYARMYGYTPAVFTFKNIPKNFFLPENERIQPLCTLRQKAALISELGVEVFFAVEFDGEFSKISPEAFVKDYIIGKLNAKHIVCGYDYRFGAGAAGDVDTLIKLCQDCGVIVTVLPPVTVDGKKISSSFIRSLIYEGRRAEAMDYAGHEL